MKNINEMTSKELKEVAKELKVKNWWTLKKAELIAAIEAAQNVEETSEDCTIVAENSNGGITIIAECHHEDINQDAQNEPEEAEEVAAEESIVEAKEAVQNESETTEEKPNKKQDLIEYNGKTQNLSQWAKELDMPGQTLFARIHLSGWTVEKAFTTPVKRRKKKIEEEA